MRIVQFLKPLFTRGVQIVAADGDDVVAAVGRGVPDGFVLAHEEDGYGGGEAAEAARVAADVYVVPCSRVGEAGLGGGC